MNCVVRRWDGARIWWPNTLLDAYPLVNLSRSNNKWESVEVYVDIETPNNLWDLLRSECEVRTLAAACLQRADGSCLSASMPADKEEARDSKSHIRFCAVCRACSSTALQLAVWVR